jgi:hypothetical protein
MNKQIATINQVVENTNEKKKDRREGKGLNLALTKKVFRLINSDTFYCESESIKDLYYFIRYESYFQWCSCKDQSTKGLKCKHIFAIEYSIMKGILQDIEKLPLGGKRYYPQVITATAKSYQDDDYDF